jgi:hypothetical protein
MVSRLSRRYRDPALSYFCEDAIAANQARELGIDPVLQATALDLNPAPIPGAIPNDNHEFGLSFGFFTSRLSSSDIGNWMLMPLGGIGLSNH